MTRIGVLFALACFFCVGFGLATPAPAKDIGNACMKSERAAGNRALCECIQHAANLSLNTKDQRLAATFFDNPHRSQEIRQSDRRGHEAFWDRYEKFALVAETYCGK